MGDSKNFDQLCRSLFPDLLTLDVIVRLRGATGAAAELGLSRQAVSNRKSAIEELLGGRLLEEHSRNQLTPLGARSHTFVKTILRELDLFLIDAERMRNGIDIRVASDTAGWFHESRILEKSYRRKVPNGTLIRTEAGEDLFSVEAAVREGRADVGIVGYPPRILNPPMVVEHWRSEQMMLAISGRRKLLRPIETAAVNDFACHDTFITLSPNLAMGKDVAKYLSRHRIRLPRRLSHFGNIASIKQAVVDDDGISILPEPLVQQERADGRLLVYPLKNSLTRRIGIVYRRDSLDRPAFRTFLESVSREKPPCLRPPCHL